MSDSENIQTIKEVKRTTKEKKKMNLTEEEKKRRSENFKKNALNVRKNNISEKKNVEQYKKTLATLLNSSTESEDEEQIYKEITKQSKQPIKKNYDLSSDEEQKNHQFTGYNKKEIKQLQELINNHKNDFNDKIQNLFKMQEVANNRIEKMYQMKKNKQRGLKSEPIVINNDKPNKIKESLQDAMLSQILNNK